MDNREDEIIKKHAIICLSETWANYTITSMPNVPEDFDLYQQPAIKEASTGRAIGGLAILINHNIGNSKLITKEQHWIFIRRSKYKYHEYNNGIHIFLTVL